MNRGVRDAQFSGHLCNRLATALSQLHCLLFEFPCVDFLDFCHTKPFPILLKYTSALRTLQNRGKLTFPSRMHLIGPIQTLTLLPNSSLMQFWVAMQRSVT